MPDGERIEFMCRLCISKGRETQAAPSPIKDDDGYPMCHVCAREQAQDIIRGCFGALKSVYRKAKGDAKDFVRKLLDLWQAEVMDVYSGKASETGRGSYTLASHRARDLLAFGRFTVGGNILEVAEKAADRAKGILGESADPEKKSLLQVVANNVLYARQEITTAGERILKDGDIDLEAPKDLPFWRRRRIWSAIGKAFNTVDRLPSAIGRTLQGELGEEGFRAEMAKADERDEAATLTTGERAPMEEAVEPVGAEPSAEVETHVPEPETPAKPKSGDGRRRSRRKSPPPKAEKPEGEVAAGPNGEEKRKRQRRRKAAIPVEEGED